MIDACRLAVPTARANEMARPSEARLGTGRREPAASSRWRYRFALVIGAACASLAAPALADDVPGVGSWSEYHFSLDATPIRLVFDHPKLSKGSLPDLVIPRAYVYLALGAPPSTIGPLPAVVETTQIALRFMGGSGEAYSTALAARARQDGTDRRKAAETLRAEVYDVKLFPTHNPDLGPKFRSSIRDQHAQIESVEGLEQYQLPGLSASYFVGGATDAFWTASCNNPVRPNYFCNYKMPITNGVLAEVSFVDFRLHGGRAEANRRLRFAREVVCRYLERC